MFIKSAAILVALAGSVAALPVKRQDITTTASSYVPKATPAGYASGYLEDYQVYHQRYLAIKCQDHRNATHKDDFFLDCCSPLLATENITEARPAYCIPSNETLSAVESQYVATSTDSLAEEEFCDEATSVVQAVSSIEATATESLSVVTLTETATGSSATAAYTLNVLQAAVTSTSSSYEAESTSSSEEWVAPSTSEEATSTSTSEWVAPTTSAYVEPTTEAYVAPSTSEAPATTQAASSGNWIGNAYATYFYQNGNAGACGVYNSDSAYIVAIPSSYYGNYGSASSNCGRWINIKRTDTGATVSAQVADVCPTCTTGTSIDLSYGAFTAIASTSEGMVPVEWQWQ